MYELWMLVAMFGTFAAVGVGTYVFVASGAERKRTMQLLQDQVGSVDMTLRQQELAQSFVDRAMKPVMGGLVALGRRITPAEGRRRIDRKLAQAGNPAAWDADKLVAYKLLATGVMFGGGWIILGGAPIPAGLKFMMLALITFIGFYGPTAIITHKADARQQEIRRALPDTMDLLTISVEAGLGFDAALVQVISNTPGPLSEEFSRLLQEMRLGHSRVQAFKNLQDRTDVDELASFILAMIQADTFGVSIAKVLREQSKELRTKRRQRAEEAAMKVPIKILFPLIFCVLPALFIVILGPGAIRIAENLFGIA